MLCTLSKQAFHWLKQTVPHAAITHFPVSIWKISRSTLRNDELVVLYEEENAGAYCTLTGCNANHVPFKPPAAI